MSEFKSKCFSKTPGSNCLLKTWSSPLYQKVCLVPAPAWSCSQLHSIWVLFLLLLMDGRAFNEQMLWSTGSKQVTPSSLVSCLDTAPWACLFKVHCSELSSRLQWQLKERTGVSVPCSKLTSMRSSEPEELRAQGSLSQNRAPLLQDSPYLWVFSSPVEDLTQMFPSSSTQRQQREPQDGGGRWQRPGLEAAGMRHQRFSLLWFPKPGLCSQGTGGGSSPSCKQAITFNALTVKHTREPGCFKDVVELSVLWKTNAP